MMMSKVRINPKKENMYECESSELKRGPWTLEEDNLLIHSITSHGEGRWNSLAKFVGLKRTGKSCRLRWLNYLKPDIKRGNLTPHEQLFILELHSKFGNRWSKIAQHLPGRTDNEIKNYWRRRVQKQARQLKIDSNSNKFLETIRTFWTPILIEKTEQNPSSSISTVDPQDYNITPPSPLISSNMVNNSDSYIPEKASRSDNFTTGKIPDCENQVENNYFYHVGFPSYGMQELGSRDISLSGCHVEGGDWFGDDLGNTPSVPQHLAHFPFWSVPQHFAHPFLDTSSPLITLQHTLTTPHTHLLPPIKQLFLISAPKSWRRVLWDGGSSTFWNTDELWQFRKSDEIGVSKDVK